MAWITPILNWVASNVVSPLDMNRIEGNTQDLKDNKVDKVTGKQLSTEDYTTAYKNKLDGIEAGAEVNNPIANNLITTTTGSALDATQGKEINDSLVAHKAKSATDAHLPQNVGVFIISDVSDVKQIILGTQSRTNSTTMTKLKEVEIKLDGTIRVMYKGYSAVSNPGAKVYLSVNGVIKYTDNAATTTQTQFIKDIEVVEGDLVQLSAQSNSGWVYIKDLEICYSVTLQHDLPVVLLDETF